MTIDALTFVQVKDAYRAMKAQALAEGDHEGWHVVDRMVSKEGVTFEVFGNERLTVKQVKVQAPKAEKPKKEPKVKAEKVFKAAFTVEKCECGMEFKRSVYHSETLCEACRKGKGEKQNYPCKTCGKIFKRSVFNPYIVKCEACR